jgi:hypothetical protein
MHSLQIGAEVTDGAMCELSRRIVLDSPNIALVPPLPFECLAPNGADAVRMPRVSFWRRAFGPERKFGGVIGTIADVHFVPGHWCYAAISWAARRGVYSDSAAGLGDAGAARAGLGRLARQQIDAQPPAARSEDPQAFGPLVLRGRQQPALSVCCGRCVLLELEEHVALGEAFFSEESVFATRGVEHTQRAMTRASARYMTMLIDMSDADERLRIARVRADNALRAANVIDVSAESSSDDDEA